MQMKQNELCHRVRQYLFSCADLQYRDFQSKLMPTVDKEKIIGVRTPFLRKYAKELFKSGEYQEFLSDLPHKYYEEDNLHGFLLEQISDADECILRLDEFLHFVDNWATCDGIKPRCFKKNPDKALMAAYRWIDGKEIYVVRFGIGVLMNYFLDGNFDERFCERVASVHSGEYYINMMCGWYFATALAKQYDTAIVYLRDRRLDETVHKITVRKAIESFRISEEKKKYIRSL